MNGFRLNSSPSPSFFVGSVVCAEVVRISVVVGSSVVVVVEVVVVVVVVVVVSITLLSNISSLLSPLERSP